MLETARVYKGRFGKGWYPDQHDTSKDQKARALFGARRFATFQGASLEQFVDHARDQRQTSTCTGFAFARAAHVRCAKMLTPIAWPSPIGLYVCGLAEERKANGQTPDTPLQDNGAQPSMVMKGIPEWGVAADTAWPAGGFDANYQGDNPDQHAFVTAEPDFSELEAASTFQPQGWYRIDTVAQERSLDVNQALENGYPVAIGVQVDNAFENYSGSGLITAPDPNGYLGGHMLCIVGYRQNSVGGFEYRVCNSWGVGWGDNGLFWADASWLQDPAAQDLLVLTVNAVSR